jgi:hypothetical protein
MRALSTARVVQLGFALALTAACHDHASKADASPSPQSPGVCDAVWQTNGFSQCDLGCADSRFALGASGPRCAATTSAGNPVDCSKTLVFSGVTGCCASDPPRLLFAVCN